MLSDRKKKILQAVVDENIRSAEPVSSGDLVEKYSLGVSPATVRNELMALEEMGYLFQPHTSSGRLPTAEGFQKYIDELMTEAKLDDKDAEKITDEFKNRLNSVEDLASRTAKILSDTTNYASVVCMQKMSEAILENIKIVKIYENLALVILATDQGAIKDISVEIEPDTTEEDCNVVSKLLTSSLVGKRLKDIDSYETGFDIGTSLAKYRNVIGEVIKAIKQREDKQVIETQGASKLLSLPEYNSIDKAKETLKLFENKNSLSESLPVGDDMEIKIQLGSGELRDCSVVSATYKVGGKNFQAGVIGPMRMDYAKVVSVLKGLTTAVENSEGNTNHENKKGETRINERKEKSKNRRKRK